MIQLDETTALEVAKAAEASLEKYGKAWRKLSKDELQEKRDANLEALRRFDTIPIELILRSDGAQEFLKLTVELGVIYMLQEGRPFYRADA